MNQRQYADPIGALFTSLIFTCKWGNLIYILLLAAIASPVCVTLLKIMKNSDFFSTPQQPFVPLLILLGIMLMSMCKNMDNTAHVRYAIEQLGGKTQPGPSSY